MPGQKLRALIQQEFDRLRNSFPQNPPDRVDSRLALLELTRAADVFYARHLMTNDHYDVELEDSYAKGCSLMLGRFVDAYTELEGVPLFASDSSSQQWTHSAIQYAGRIRDLEHLLDLHQDGLFDLTQIGPAEFEFRLTSNGLDVEAFDVADSIWLRHLAKDIDRPRPSLLTKEQPSIQMRMKRLVYPWRENFIGYRTDPIIDDHFESSGIAWGRTLTGQLELPGDAVIGGLPFYAYRAAVGIMCGRALKHAAFARELFGCGGHAALKLG